MSTLAIVLSLILLIVLAYRGITVLLLAPLMASLAVLLSGEAGLLLPIYTGTFMSALGGYLIKFFPLFILGALFGQLPEPQLKQRHLADPGVFFRVQPQGRSVVPTQSHSFKSFWRHTRRSC